MPGVVLIEAVSLLCIYHGNVCTLLGNRNLSRVYYLNLFLLSRLGGSGITVDLSDNEGHRILSVKSGIVCDLCEIGSHIVYKISEKLLILGSPIGIERGLSLALHPPESLDNGGIALCYEKSKSVGNGLHKLFVVIANLSPFGVDVVRGIIVVLNRLYVRGRGPGSRIRGMKLGCSNSVFDDRVHSVGVTESGCNSKLCAR